MWYAAQTKFNKEFDVRDRLERNGFPDTFVPSYLVKYDSGNIRPRLLFRNYIFVAMDDPDRWPDIQATPNVTKVMTHPPPPEQAELGYRRPSAVSDAALDSLRKCAEAQADIWSGALRRRLEIITEGCYVRVLRDGPLRPELQRALVTWADQQKVRLLLDMFNRKVSVEFYRRDVTLAEQS